MNDKSIENDITSIRAMMERSSKFISLSGLSGILAGIYALAGAGAAWFVVKQPMASHGLSWFNDLVDKLQILTLIAVGVLVASILTGVLLTIRKARKKRQSVWGKTSRALMFNLAVPILTGMVFTAAMLYFDSDNYIFILPATLIFYGLGLVNASHFTFGDVKYLGLGEIILGLIACLFPDYSLLLWAIGFGILHIVYGAVMHLKYDRESTI